MSTTTAMDADEPRVPRHAAEAYHRALMALDNAVTEMSDACGRDAEDLATALMRACGMPRMLRSLAECPDGQRPSDLRAHVRSVHEAFGAPGDWGYGHPVGRALQQLYAVHPAPRLPAPRLEDMTEPQLQTLMTHVADLVKSALGHVQGQPKFCVLVFNDPAVAQYVSSCRRAEMIQALRESADRFEAGQALPRT